MCFVHSFPKIKVFNFVQNLIWDLETAPLATILPYSQHATMLN